MRTMAVNTSTSTISVAENTSDSLVPSVHDENEHLQRSLVIFASAAIETTEAEGDNFALSGNCLNAMKYAQHQECVAGTIKGSEARASYTPPRTGHSSLLHTVF